MSTSDDSKIKIHHYEETTYFSSDKDILELHETLEEVFYKENEKNETPILFQAKGQRTIPIPMLGLLSSPMDFVTLVTAELKKVLEDEIRKQFELHTLTEQKNSSALH